VLTVAGIAVGASMLLVGTGMLRLWRTHAREGLELRRAAAAR
jgi:hypothetical protein